MNVSRFELGNCPRISAVKARATRAALPVMATLAPRWETDATPSGRTVVMLEGLAHDDANPDDVALPVTIGIDRSRLVVDVDFATRLVDAALIGKGAFRSARRFGPAERGMLAGLLGGAFQGLGWRIGLERVPHPEAGVALASFRVETPLASGRLWLAIHPAPPASPGISEGFRGRARRLPIVAAVQIAATNVAAREVARIAVGDAVVFDGYAASPFSTDGAWPGELALGTPVASHGVAIEIDAARAIKVVGGFEARAEALRGLEKETGMEPTGGTDATVALAAAAIEVVAEVGRIRLRGDEVMGLTPGAVLALPGGRTRVSLRVAGELLGEGELVDVDGELGVRVTRIAAR